MADKPTSALAELLWEWMGKQRPVYNPHKLAHLVGVSPQTVYNWLNGRRPELSLLMTVAAKTGIAYKRLAAAAGYPTDPDPDAIFRRMLQELDARTDFDETERRTVRRFIEELRGHDECGGDDDAPSTDDPRGLREMKDAIAC